MAVFQKHEQEQLCLAGAMESGARLENENTDLLSQMDTMRCFMQHPPLKHAGGVLKKG